MVRIKDLSEDDRELYFVCLEDWSDEMKESGGKKREWYEKAKSRGLRVKLAEAEGVVGGMIQYLPIEFSPASGRDLYFIHCIWVHGYKEGRGSFRGMGMGPALLEAAEADARALGAKGMAAWGLSIPVWMRASWFKRRGYKKADKDGPSVLLWKPFSYDAEPPKWYRQRKTPAIVPGKVSVSSFVNGWCPGQNIVYERAKRVAAEFPETVEFTEIDTSERGSFEEWGITDGLFVDGKTVRTGPPPSVEKIRALVQKRVRRLERRR